jgi:hypothetical protein
MKPARISDDPGLRLTPRGRRVRSALIVAGLLLLLILALTDRAGAAPARLCTAWRTTCTASRTIFGVRICYAWRTTCVSAAPTGKIAGLAAPRAGNRGGCSVRSQRAGLHCTVQDAGVGWVSGTCVYGEYFLAQTARTFAPGESVTVSGCSDDHNTLFSAPGYRLRISK